MRNGDEPGIFYLVSSEHTQLASNTEPRRIAVRMCIYVIERESIMTSKSVDESVRECDVTTGF